MAVTIITPPALEPVTLAEMKAHLNLTTTDDDDLVTVKIAAARRYIEEATGLRFISTTLELTADTFPGGILTIPAGPVQSETSGKYADADGVEQTFADYSADVATGRIKPGDDGWPSTADTLAAVRVRFVAGFGATAADVPAALREAVMQLAATWYENREAVAVGVSAALLPLSVRDIIRDFRAWSF